MTLPRALRADWADLAHEYISNDEDRETARALASCEILDYLNVTDEPVQISDHTHECRDCGESYTRCTADNETCLTYGSPDFTGLCEPCQRTESAAEIDEELPL